MPRRGIPFSNRRLLPLGHLTADVQVYEIQALTRSAHEGSNGCEKPSPLMRKCPGMSRLRRYAQS
jgi:hypothetical protein